MNNYQIKIRNHKRLVPRTSVKTDKNILEAEVNNHHRAEAIIQLVNNIHDIANNIHQECVNLEIHTSTQILEFANNNILILENITSDMGLLLHKAKR